MKENYSSSSCRIVRQFDSDVMSNDSNDNRADDYFNLRLNSTLNIIKRVREIVIVSVYLFESIQMENLSRICFLRRGTIGEIHNRDENLHCTKLVELLPRSVLICSRVK